MITFEVHAQQGFNQQPIHPAGGAGIPGPATLARVRREGIDIGGDNVRLDFVGGDLFGSPGVMNGIEHLKELPSAVIFAHERKDHRGPDRAVCVLASVFAHIRIIPAETSSKQIHQCPAWGSGPIEVTN